MGTRLSLLICECKTACLDPEWLLSICPSLHLWFFAFTTATLSIWIYSLHGSQTSPVVLCMQNSVIRTRITSLHWSQTSPVVLCRQNSVISARITSLYGSQTSPVVLCMQNKVISMRIVSLYGSQISPLFKTASLVSELLVSMGLSPHLWFLLAKQRL